MPTFSFLREPQALMGAFMLGLFVISSCIYAFLSFPSPTTYLHSLLSMSLSRDNVRRKGNDLVRNLGDCTNTGLCVKNLLQEHGNTYTQVIMYVTTMTYAELASDDAGNLMLHITRNGIDHLAILDTPDVPPRTVTPA